MKSEKFLRKAAAFICVLAGLFFLWRLAPPPAPKTVSLRVPLKPGQISSEKYVITESAIIVQRVVDGDTVVLSDGTRVRLIGVDTPETKHPRKPVEYFGKEASEFTRREIEGKPVRLEYDWQRTDKYGRTLAYIYRLPDNFFLNAELVKQGYGHAYTRFPFKYMEDFRTYEREAREKGLGLWKAT